MLYLCTVALVTDAMLASGAALPTNRADAHDPATAWEEDLNWCWHHMGTTRMHENPAHGVVDANCKVHGVANLFIAGSSVFPTASADTPTLTIVALALRLAEHLVLTGAV